ncbi:MAG: ShlB/FhaC/HecB family hemolysin secretion/activation protein [Halomonadaceae bacterium]|nr:MAG: ShlB/FhaC/HecB family hemolysin secretion/activation protein [Halomonadaceae bacterium]
MRKRDCGLQGRYNGAVRCLTLGALLSAAPWLMAQEIPEVGDVLQQLPQVPPVVRSEPGLPEVGGIPLEPPMEQLPDDAPKILVNGFDMEGNTVVGRNRLLTILEGEAGKRHTLAELEELARRLSNYYRSQGYFLARAYLPAQEVVDGVIRFRIVEGQYGEFDLVNDSRVQDDIIQGVLSRASEADVVSVQSLERALLLLNDLPGVQVSRADAQPGQVPGTSDFAIGTDRTPGTNGYVVADNHGLKSTGENRLSASLDINSPFQRGHRLGLTGLVTEDGNLINGRVEVSSLLSSSGLQGDIALAQTRYELGDEFKSLEAEGEALSVVAGLSYPVIRSSGRNLNVGLSRTYRQLTDEVGVVDVEVSKRVNSFAVDTLFRQERVIFAIPTLLSSALTYTVGDLDIRDDLALMIDQAPGGPQTQGTFSRLNLDTTVSVLLPMSLQTTVSVRGQKGLDRNLDGSERMGLAGASGVMAYPSGEFSGRDAALARLEFSRRLPSFAGLEHQAQLFGNVGRGQRAKDDEWRTLGDAGIGWSFSHGQGLFLRTYAAARLTSEARSEKTSRVNFLAQLGWVF